MNNKIMINFLVVLIAVLSVISSLFGLLSKGGPGQREFVSINGEKVTIYGQGIYKNDSLSIVAQGKASDLITLTLAVPLLLASLFITNKKSYKGRLLLTGTLGYFLYTYVSYVFLWMYNILFLVYVSLMSLSLFAFIICMMSFDVKNIKDMFNKKLPKKFLGGFQILVATIIGLLWLRKISEGSNPSGLEHYTTLVIQGMDLGIIVPTAFLSGILLIKNKPYGYLLSSVVIIKGITLLLAICGMILNVALQGLSISIVELVIFGFITIIAIVSLVVILKNVNSIKTV